MDPMENSGVNDDCNSEEQQNQSEEAESGARPSLSQVKKSWGFRRTTIARREFLDEVGDLNHSPLPARRGRNRRSNQTPQATPETRATQRPTRAARSVIEDLEWSAPSSPASEESKPASEASAEDKPASEASAGGSLDPSLWQDFGSAFHTAFSLLGGGEDLPMETSNTLTVPDIFESTDAVEAPPPEATDEPEVPENVESGDEMEISQPVEPEADNVAGEEIDDVVLISSQEEDSDEMTLIQIKEQLASKGRQGDARARGGKGGRGKARGRGRGRGRGKGKGRGRGRGRGRAVELESIIADNEDSDDDMMLVHPAEQRLQQLQEEEKVNDPLNPAELGISPAHSDITLSPAQRSSSDCIIIDSDLDQNTDVTPGQYDDAPAEEEAAEKEEKKDDMNVGEYSDILRSQGYDSNALYCICRQKHNKRFMICCDSCQEWFHGSCVGISKTQGRKMEKRGQEYICPPCTTKKQNQLQPEPHPQPEPELSFPESLTLSPSGEEGGANEEQQAPKETVVVVEEEEEAPVVRPEPEPEAKMETDSCLPLCIGPGCSKQALPDSVYCGTDCILQHAAVTMKTLSGPKVPKSKGRAQRKAAAARPTAKAQRSSRMSKRLAGKAEEECEAKEEEETKEDAGGQKEAASPLACDPVQATSIPPSKFYTASNTKNVEADTEDVSPSKQLQEDTSTHAAPLSQPISEPAPPQSDSQEKTKEPVNSGVSKQQSAESNPCIPPNPTKSGPTPALQSPSTSAPRHHETGALMVTKTTYVIPKKQSTPQPLSKHVPASTSCQKPSSAPTLLNETRNLPVPPAPSAPSSRPSQPNNQVRQSIQRSLVSILFKRVCDCGDLEMTESEVAKLVQSIEMEMFDIFRNTDSKYMNKYRTIMFNLKDPKNKGLLYRVVRGEISPFRLARMSQKDMQAIKASEPSAKETTEAKDAAAKTTSLLQKPEAVKVDLPSLNPTRPDRSAEQKKSLPAPPPKTRTIQPSQSSAIPDIFACMLKDTTSEHKTHLFDLKCKICTGQMLAGDEEELPKKNPKISETKDKYEPSWRKSAGDDSPLRAPPDSPDMESPTSSLTDPSSRLIIDSPVLTIVESPASPVMESPASPTLESPTSPVMESPASPTQDTSKTATTKREYTPVVIPAVSTVTITRRDPRTAASRFSSAGASSADTSGPRNTTNNQSVPYAPLQETRSASSSAPASSLPPTKTLPKSILMKPSSSADPRLYGTSSRTTISESPADETAQFLAKKDIVWKGFLNMLTVAKFVTKGYLVSGCAESLKVDLPDTIQIGGRILPQTVWDYVAKLRTSITKELCVIRFHPATEEEEVAYVSLFSYFSSRGRFGVVANSSRSIKDFYLVPLSAKESIPSILQPLEGPGLEKRRPNLLLGLAIIQKTKRPGILPQEIEEKRPKVHMSKDPMWIPKPPVLYGSDKLEIFQPYDPETPTNTTPPGSPSCPGSPSESSSSGSVTVPSLLTSIRANPPVSTSVTVAASRSTSDSIIDKNPTTASDKKTPLQTILKSLFGNKETDSVISSDGSSTTKVNVKKPPVFSQVSGSMVDPIVQQYGQKSKVKKIEEEENDFDRPYDPEEEYDPAMGYGRVASQSVEKIKANGPAVSGSVEDDVAYDPEDETIFADIQSDTITKPPVLTQMSDSPECSTPISTQAVTPVPTSTSVQITSTARATQNLPTGTVVVSAATLTEQQRMLEELNKQIEEQKRQLKEQEEALRQQREAVGMFMAHFSVSDSLMSPPSKSLPLSQLSSLQSSVMQTESRPSESSDKTSNLTNTVECSNVDSQTVKLEDTTATLNLKNDTDPVTEQDETQEDVKDSDKSAGEIEDSDVAYDPEDESLFNEIQDDVFQGTSINSCESSLSRTGLSGSHKGTLNSYHSRKRRLSPKRRSHRERDRHRSPSKKSHRHSPSRSHRHRERDRHRRSERDRSRHRARDQSERQGRHRKEHTSRRHSHGRRKSPSSPRKKHSVSLSPKQQRAPSPEVLEKPPMSVTIKNDPDGKCNVDVVPDNDFPPCSHELPHNVKLEILEPTTFQELSKNSVSDHDNTSRGSSTQMDKLSQQETLLNDKIDSTIPLREIDPPIRDSPQSPDPEPQFLNSSRTGKSEEIKDLETCVSMPFVKVEDNCLSIGGQATMFNTLWPTVGGPVSDVKNLDFIALELQGPGVRDHGIIKADKPIEEKSSDLTHPEKVGQVGGHSATSTDIPGLRPEIDPMTNRLGPGLSGPGNRNPGADMKEPGHGRPQIYQRDTGIRFPGPHMRGPGIQGINPSIWVPGANPQDLALSIQGKYVNDLGTGVQGSGPNIKEADIQHHNTERIGSGPVMRGSGLMTPVQDMESSSIQGVNPEVKGPGPNMRNNEAEMRDTDPVMKRPGPDMRGSGSRGPLSAMYHPSPDGVMKVGRDQSFGSPQIEGRAPDIIGRGRGQNDRGESPHTGGMRSAMRGRGLRDPGPSFRGSGRVQGQSRHDNSPVLSRVGGGQERSLDLDATTVSEGAVLRTDGLPPAMSNERQDPQRGQDVPMREPGTNINYQSDGPNMSCIGKDSAGPRKHLKEPWSERNVCGPDMRDSETVHELRRPNMVERSYMGSSQDMSSVGRSDAMSDRSQLHAQSSGRDTGSDWSHPGSNIKDDRRGPERRGPYRGGPCMPDEWRVNQHDRRGPNMEDLRHERRGPGGPDVMAPGPLKRGPDMEIPVHDRRGPGGPDFIGPRPERGGSDIEVPIYDRRGPGGSDFRRPEPEMQGLPNENLVPDMRGPGGPDFVGPSNERRGVPMESPGPNRRGPAGPDFRGPWSDRRVPRDQDVWGPGPKRRHPAMEGAGTDRERHGGPDFHEPGPERRGFSMEDPGPARRGPGGLDFRGPERRGPIMEGTGTDMRQPEGPGFRGIGPESRGLPMNHPGPDRRGPGGSDSRGPGSGRRSLSMERPEHDIRRPGGPDLRGPGPERRSLSMEHPGTDSRGPGDIDFRESGPEMRGPSMEAPGRDRRGPGGPDFSGPWPDRRGPAMGGPGPDRRESGVPNFSRPGHERSAPTMDNQKPDRRGPRGPDFGGPGGPDLGGPGGPDFGGPGGPDFGGPGGPDFGGPGGPDFSGQGPGRRGPAMGGPGPERRGLGVPDFSGPIHERSGHTLDSQEPDHRGPRGPDFQGQGSEMRCLVIDRPGPDRRGLHMRGPRPDFIGVGPEETGPGIEDPGTHCRGQGGAHFRVSGTESGHPNMEGPGPGGPNIRRPGLQHLDPNIEGPVPDRRGPGGPNFRGPGPGRRPPDMEGIGNSRGFPGGPQFRGPEPEIIAPDMGGAETDRRGPHFGGVRPERAVMEGPGPDRKGPRGPVLRGPDVERPGTDWRRSGDRGFRGPYNRPKGPDTEGQRHTRDDWGGDDIGGSESIQDRPDTEGRGPARTCRNLRGPGPIMRNIREPGPDMSSLNHRDGWKGPDFRASAPDRRVTDTEEQWEDGRGSNMEAVGIERKYSDDDWKRHGNRGPAPIEEGLDDHSRQGPPMEWRSREPNPMQDRPNMPFPEHLRVPEDGWGGSGCRGSGPVQDNPDMVYPGPDRGGPENEWREPDRGCAGPKRWGAGPFFGPRDPDTIGHGPDRRGPGMTGPGSDMRGGPAMGNDWREPNLRGMRGLNMKEPGAYRGDPNLENMRGYEMEGLDRRGPRCPDLSEGPGTDERFLDCRGQRPERQRRDIESPGTDRHGFEHDFRRKRRGSDIRKHGLARTHMRGSAPETSDIRHGPERWDTNNEGLGSHPRRSEPPSPNFNSPHQVSRSQGSSDPHSAPYSGPPGPGFDNPQSQQTVKPQRHRAALLPTPTEGLIRFPNHMINNPDVFSPKRKQMGHPTDREWKRGRPLSRERDLVKRQKLEQEQSPVDKIRTPVDACTEGGGEQKKEVCESKINPSMDNDENKSNVKKS